MANKRMLSNNVINTDDFLKLPHSAGYLYFMLNLSADDEGFNTEPKAIMDKTKTHENDFQLLLDAGFIIPFPTGVLVIRHWFLHNNIRPERGNTNHLKEKFQVGFSDEGLYELISEEQKEESLGSLIEQNDGKLLTLSKIKELKSKKRKSVYLQLDNSDGVPLAYTGEERLEEVRLDKESGSPNQRTNTKYDYYGQNDNVLLKQEEYEVIKNTYARSKDLIDKAGFIFLNSNKKYKSHYAFIMKIAIEDDWPKNTEPQRERIRNQEKQECLKEQEEKNARKQQEIEKLMDKNNIAKSEAEKLYEIQYREFVQSQLDEITKKLTEKK